MVKETMIWIIGSATALYLSVASMGDKRHYFRDTVSGTFRVTVFIEFFVNLYVFNVFVEFLLVPFVTLLAMLSVVAGQRAKTRPAKALVDFLLTVTGLGLVGYVVSQFISNWQHLDAASGLRTLALPIWLTVAVVPYLYLLALYSSFEGAFLRLDFVSPGRRAKWRWKGALVIGLAGRPRLAANFGGAWPGRLVGTPSLRSAISVVRTYARAQGIPSKPS
jgi:hypothetical protein